jgi:hypothetical protein
VNREKNGEKREPQEGTEVDRRVAVGMIAAGVTAAGAAAVVLDGDDKVAETKTSNGAVTADPEAAISGIETLPEAGPWPTQDPFLFCVHHNDQYPAGTGNLGPAASLTGRQMGSDFANKDGWNMYHGREVPGFPRHPHRGFETVTLVKKGLIDHADSLGAAARYGDGDVQWLTAGDGINHAEMFPLTASDRPNPIDFYQIWVNLPAARKRAAPHFKMLWRENVPIVEASDSKGRVTRVRVVAGSYGEARAPAPPPASWASEDDSDLAIWTIELSAGARWTLPTTHSTTSRTLYVVNGHGVGIGQRRVESGHRILLDSAHELSLKELGSGTELLLLQARPIAEPVAQHGPFVMNTREEIAEAIRDYRRTQFGAWPWPADAPVHGRDPKRFCLHGDGQREEPT